MYQSRFGFVRDDRLSANQGCAIDEWLGTKSRITFSLRRWASAISASNSASVPNSGSIPQ